MFRGGEARNRFGPTNLPNMLSLRLTVKPAQLAAGVFVCYLGICTQCVSPLVGYSGATQQSEM